MKHTMYRWHLASGEHRVDDILDLRFDHGVKFGFEHGVVELYDFPGHGLAPLSNRGFLVRRPKIVHGTGHVLFQEARITKCAGFRALSTIMLPVMKYALTINDPTYISTGDEADIHVFAESVLGAGRKTGSFVESKLITLDDVPHEILKAGILSRLSNRNSSSLKHIPIWKTMRRIK